MFKANQSVVCINVPPALDFIEIIELQDGQRDIQKMGALPAAIDPASRQIEDTDRMMQVIKDLYEANRIALSTPTVLVLPSFFTREIELPSEFTPDELRVTLTSEAERFYIFKKNEPHVEWLRLNETTLLYSAYPKVEIDKYIRIFQTLRIPLLSIEIGYFSILKSLVASGAIRDQIENEKSWCFLVLSDYSFFTAICVGQQFQKTMESPLSIGIEDESSKVSEIQQDFAQFIGYETFDRLVIINNATSIRVESVLSRLNFQGELTIIEQNGETLRSRGALQGEYPASLEAIGGALSKQFPDFVSLNLKPAQAEDLVGILNLRRYLLLGLGAANGAALVLVLLVWGILSLLNWSKESEIQQLNEQLTKIQTGQNAMTIHRKLFVRKKADENEHINNLLVKMGALMPNEVWMTRLTVKSAAKEVPQSMQALGGAIIPELVSQFQNDLNKALGRTDLEVKRVDLANSSDSHSFYEWEIQTKAPPAASKPPG